jgi:hypothetical protein
MRPGLALVWCVAALFAQPHARTPHKSFESHCSCMNLAEQFVILCPSSGHPDRLLTLRSPADGDCFSFGRAQVGPIDTMVRRSEYSSTCSICSRMMPRTLGCKAGNYGVKTQLGIIPATRSVSQRHAPVGIDRSLCLELVILLVSFVSAVDE